MFSKLEMVDRFCWYSQTS